MTISFKGLPERDAGIINYMKMLMKICLWKRIGRNNLEGKVGDLCIEYA